VRFQQATHPPIYTSAFIVWAQVSPRPRLACHPEQRR